MLGRLFRLVIVGWIASMVAAAVAAMSVKRRLTPTTDESADQITAVAIFGPLAFHSTSKALRGGELECWYGGGVLDLRDAQLAPEGATLRVRAIFGGGQVIVPPSWNVVTHVRGMGGIQDVRPAQGRSAIDPDLVIEGMLIAGGFMVTSELAEGEDQWLAAMKEGQGGTPAVATAIEPAATVEPAAEPEPPVVAEGTVESVPEPEATEPTTTDEPGGESEATEAYAPTT